MTDLAASLATAKEQLAAASALHQPVNGYCYVCHKRSPCPTLQALVGVAPAACLSAAEAALAAEVISAAMPGIYDYDQLQALDALATRLEDASE